MTEPNFDDITGSEDSETTTTDSNTGNRGFAQVHIKGQFGTHTYTNEADCVVCGRKAGVMLLVGVNPDAEHDDHDDDIRVCSSHAGDVRGDLEYPPEQVKTVEF